MKKGFRNILFAAALMLTAILAAGFQSEAAGRVSVTMTPQSEVAAGKTAVFQIAVYNGTDEDYDPGVLGVVLQVFTDGNMEGITAWTWSGDDFVYNTMEDMEMIAVNQKPLSAGGTLKMTVAGMMPPIWKTDGTSTFEAILVGVREDGKEELVDIAYYMSLPYKDVAVADWYFNSVAVMYQTGIMTGKEADTFAPGEKIVRGQFATMLWRLAAPDSETPYDSNRFKDVPDNRFFTVPVMWASTNNIITGYTDSGRFGPGDAINREQIAVLMYRYAKFAGYDTSARGNLTDFPDGSKVTPYAQEAMSWAVGSDLISGDGSGRLNPQGTAVRAEAAAIFTRFVYQFYLE